MIFLRREPDVTGNTEEIFPLTVLFDRVKVGFRVLTADNTEPLNGRLQWAYLN